MPKTKRLVVLFASVIGVLLCSLMLFATVTATQGVVIYDPKYFESKGPYSYTFTDWLGDIAIFLRNASPFILGTTAAVFGLYLWLNRSEAQTRNRAGGYAARAAIISFLIILVSIFAGEIVVYKEASRKIARLNKYGPPR